MHHPIRKVNILLDWDSTLTKHDTLAVFVSICHGAAQKLHSDAPNPSPTPWSALSAAYLADYTSHNASYRPIAAGRTTKAEEFAWLASLESVERASWARATSQLSPLPISDLQHHVAQAIRSKQIELRPGWDSLAKAALSSGVEMGIVSVNWSETFIRTCLLESARIEGLSNAVVDFLQSMRIHSNELLTTPARGGMHTSADKARILRSFRSESVKTVYVGDSSTDLECLLLVDVGVCIRDEEMSSSQADLASTLARLNILVRPLSEVLANPESTKEASSQTILHTTSLHEVTHLLP